MPYAVKNQQLIRKFNRFELKYILDLKTATHLKTDILQYALHDPHSNPDGKYTISSLYYDSPDFRFYREKLDGIRVRRKLRIRWYATPEGLKDDTVVFLEIKQRVDRVTQKRRMPIKYKDALLFCNEGIIPEYDPQDAELVEEVDSMLKSYMLKPTVITTYDRRAYVGTHYDMGFRLTFDNNIYYNASRNGGLYTDVKDGFIIPPNFVIMEIKTNERVPYWVTEIVAGHNLQLVRVSKYCLGVQKSFI